MLVEIPRHVAPRRRAAAVGVGRKNARPAKRGFASYDTCRTELYLLDTTYRAPNRAMLRGSNAVMSVLVLIQTSKFHCAT